MKELSKLGVEAVLAGKALPSELMVGESLAKYFARLYLHTKDSRDEQLAQRDAQIAALTDENVALMQRIDWPMEQCPTTGAVTAVDPADFIPATDAAANALRAEGVNHAGKMVMAMLNHQDKGVGRALEIMAQVEMNYIKPAGGSVAQ